MAKQRKRKERRVCKEHWQMVRKEALATIPFWSRPFAGKKVTQYMHDKRFVQSTEECIYCRSKSTTNQGE